MKIVCIIPARLGSYRFNNKPLVNICGKTMIEHVYKLIEYAYKGIEHDIQK